MLLPVVFLVPLFLLSQAMVMAHSGHLQTWLHTNLMCAPVLSTDLSGSRSRCLCTFRPAGWAQQLRDSLGTTQGGAELQSFRPREEPGWLQGSWLQGNVAGCLEKPLLPVGQDMLQ